MRTKALLAFGFGVTLAAPAAAAPRVAADIPAVHSLAARVMAGVGTPDLILPPGASPHGYAMRPSEAARLQDAQVVVWVGEELTPWLARAVETIAVDATSLQLLDVPGVTLLQFREGATFEAHDHAHEAEHDHDHAAEHAHDHDHAAEAEHDHSAEAEHDHAAEQAHDHAHDEEHAHDHAHEGVDPHAWLDPVNAKVWLDAIAGALSSADPANAATYFQNAAAGKAELDALIAEIQADLTPLQGAGFVVFHDAYHYFEARFGIEATGAIALSDAAPPSPARVAEIRDAIRGMDATCVFREPQFEPALVETVIEGTDARVGQLDPVGATLQPGPDLYPTLLRNLRDELVACLGA